MPLCRPPRRRSTLETMCTSHLDTSTRLLDSRTVFSSQETFPLSFSLFLELSIQCDAFAAKQKVVVAEKFRGLLRVRSLAPLLNQARNIGVSTSIRSTCSIGKFDCFSGPGVI